MSKLLVRQSKQEKKREEKAAYGYNVNRVYRSIHSSVNLLSANHLFGNCAKNRLLELVYNANLFTILRTI